MCIYRLISYGRLGCGLCGGKHIMVTMMCLLPHDIIHNQAYHNVLSL